MTCKRVTGVQQLSQLVLVAWFFASVPSWTSAVEFSDALDQYVVRTALPDHVILNGKVVGHQNIIKPPPGGLARGTYLVDEESTFLFRRDGLRLDAEQTRNTHPRVFASGAFVSAEDDRTMYNRCFVDEKTWLQYHRDGAEPTTAPANRSTPIGGVYVRDSRASATRAALSMLGELRAWYGYFPDNNAPIGDLLRKGSKQIVITERLAADEPPVIALSADTEDGIIRVWVDRESFLPHRVEVRKERPKDKLYHTTLAESHFVAFVIVADHFVTKRFGERELPVGVRVTQTWTRDSGEVVEAVSDAVCDGVSLNPKFTGDAFTPNFRDGTPARIDGVVDGLKYEWRGGKVGPATLPSLSKSLDRAVTQAATMPDRK